MQTRIIINSYNLMCSLTELVARCRINCLLLSWRFLHLQGLLFQSDGFSTFRVKCVRSPWVGKNVPMGLLLLLSALLFAWYFSIQSYHRCAVRWECWLRLRGWTQALSAGNSPTLTNSSWIIEVLFPAGKEGKTHTGCYYAFHKILIKSR